MSGELRWPAAHAHGGGWDIADDLPGGPPLSAVAPKPTGLGGLKLDIVSKTPTDCDQTKGVAAAEDLLTANPGVKAIYGACGPPIVGALQAIANAGIKPAEILVVGFDADPDQVAAIVAGDEDAIAQFPDKIGELGVDTLLKAINGESVPAFVDTGTEVVTVDNVADYK